MNFSLRSMFTKEGTQAPVSGGIASGALPLNSLPMMDPMTQNGASSGPAPFGGALFRTLTNEPDTEEPHGFEAGHSPFSAPAAAEAETLTVADLLPQLPPEVARAGAIPQDQPVQIAPQILSQALSSGQLAVPLFEVYRVCPGIFQRAVAPDDQRMVNLPPAKLPTLISAAAAAPALSAATPQPAFTPGSLFPGEATAAPPVSPFASLFAQASQTPPAPVMQEAAAPAMSAPEAARASTMLPPRRDPGQPPASSLPSGPFFDGGSPFAASPPPAGSPFAAASASGQTPPVSPFPAQPASPFGMSQPAAPETAPAPAFSLFQAAEPEAEPPASRQDTPSAAGPAPFALFQEAAAAGPAPASAFAPGKKITGAATASVAALLHGQSAEALGFDPAMVPSWITTQFHGGLVAELQDMTVPTMDLGTIVDGITDIGFRNVLNTARRDHAIPVPLEVLTPVAAAAPAGETLTAAPPPSSMFAQPAPALANPFASVPPEAPPQPAPATTANPFKIEPGNPFASVPDAPPPTAAPEPLPSVPPAAEPPPEPPAASPFVQPKADIEGLFANAGAAAAPPSPPPAPPKLPGKVIDPFAPVDAGAASGGFSSFDLLGGGAQPAVEEKAEAASPFVFPQAEPEPKADAPAAGFGFDLPEIPVPATPPPQAAAAFATPESASVDIPPAQPSAFFKADETEAPPRSSPPVIDVVVDDDGGDIPPSEPPLNPAHPEPMTAATFPPPRATHIPPAKPSLGLSALAPSGEEQLVLRALLDSDEDMGLQRIIELTTALPGIAACVLIRDGQVLAGSSTKSAEAKAFRGQAADVAKNLRSLAPLIGITDAETFTLNTDTRLITLCFPGEVTLAILHDREPSLGQRDKLTLIARQLERLTAAN